MEPSCFGSLQTCAARVAALNANGTPQAGLHGYATTSIMSASPGVDIEEGDDKTQKNGCGQVCQTFRGCDVIKRATIDLAMCQLDLQFAFLAVGGTLFMSLDVEPVALGYQVPKIDDPCPDGVCLEVWTKAWDGDEQATPESLSNAVAYWHWVFPRTRLQLSDQDLNDDFLEFSLEGFSDANSNMAASGPFGDWPDYIEDAGGITSSWGVFLDTVIPTQTCELSTVTEGS